MTSCTDNSVLSVAPPSIPGGHALIMPKDQCLLWSAYELNVISLNAFKVWWSTLEARSWRRDQPECVLVTDTMRITHMPESVVVAALARLSATGLLELNDGTLRLMPDVSLLPEAVRQRARAMYDLLHPKVRDKAIRMPRRLLRELIRAGKRVARIAAILGMVTRTMLAKRAASQGAFIGRVKASWLSEMYNISLGAVKVARGQLIREGWFATIPDVWKLRQRWGLRVALSLRPVRPVSAPSPEVAAPPEIPPAPESDPAPEPNPAASQLIPLNGQNGMQLIPPFLNPDLSTEIENHQELAREEEAGVVTNKDEEQIKEEDGGQGKKPSWSHIERRDLSDPGRRWELYESALTLGAVAASEPGKLLFFSGVAKVLRLGSRVRNVGGFLRSAIEDATKRDWIAQIDEDTAIAWLRQRSAESRHERQARASAPPPSAPRSEAGSEETWDVAAAFRQLQAKLWPEAGNGDPEGGQVCRS